METTTTSNSEYINCVTPNHDRQEPSGIEVLTTINFAPVITELKRPPGSAPILPEVDAYDSVLSKLHKDPYYADLSTQKLQQVARTFSDVDKFRDKYFNYDKIFGDDCDSSLKTIDGEPTIKVKFIITDVKSRPNKHVRRYTTRILKKIHKAPKYGLYHSAVCIGPTLLEWSKASVCVVRPCASSSAILAMDIAIFKGEQCIRDLLQEISSIVVEWNSSRWFGWGRSKNCQFFIDDTLQRLNIRLDFPKSITEYIEVLRKDGSCDAMLILTPEMKQRLHINQKKLKFNTHTELDDFVRDLNEKWPEFQFTEDGMLVMELLKVFDRALWLRYFKAISKSKHVDVYKPHICPFGDPRRTLTHWHMKTPSKELTEVDQKKCSLM